MVDSFIVFCVVYYMARMVVDKCQEQNVLLVILKENQNIPLTLDKMHRIDGLGTNV